MTDEIRPLWQDGVPMCQSLCPSWALRYCLIDDQGYQDVCFPAVRRMGEVMGKTTLCFDAMGTE